MTDEDTAQPVITEPGVLLLGSRLATGSHSRVASFFRDKSVVHVSCGSYHTAVVCKSGLVYTITCSSNEAGDAPRVTSVDTLAAVRVTQAACGYKFIVYLTDKGELYVWGRNKDGQLGLGHRSDHVTVPVLVTGLPPIKKVAAGCEHTVVLAEGGEVWACGNNYSRQLGLNRTDTQTSFTRVPGLPVPIIDIACGGSHTALISASGVLLMAGENTPMGVCIDSEALQTFKPVSVSSTGIAAVSCGYYHTVALGVDGTTWAWGLNDAGQLGTGDTTNRSTPTKVIGLEERTVLRVIAGGDRSAVLTHEGDALMFGSGKYSELGLGSQNLLTATLLPKSPGLVVQQVAFALTFSLVLVVPSLSPTPKLQIGSPEQGDRANHCPTDLERIIAKSLECPVCFKIMCAPIHLCVKGHSLCGSCRSNSNTTVCPLCREQFSVGRNITLESLSEEMVLPCVECLQRMPACLLEKHGWVCPAREYVCPVSDRCGWAGRPETMLAHTTSAHPDRTWTHLPHVFLHSTSDRLLRTDLLAAHGQVFTLHRRYDDQEFRAVVRYLGQPENSHQYNFELTFIANKISNTYCRNVCSDMEGIEDSFQSPSKCVSIKKETADTFLQQRHLVCRVAILKVEGSGLSDQIKDLLSGLGLSHSSH